MNKRSSKKLLFTFDYELFLGRRSGTVSECLLQPTEKLLKILRNHKIKAIFFVDSTYLIKLLSFKEKYPLAANDWTNIVLQLHQIIKDGHYLFPHLHPHWLDAQYRSDINEWDLSNCDKYRFSSISEGDKELLWSNSMKVLREIINSIYPNYKIDSYRAGGWSIQPFSDFKPYFEKYGIVNDFSVIPGKYIQSSAHSFSFSEITCNSPYNFEGDILNRFETGEFKEYPISAISYTRFQKWVYFKVSGIIKRLGLAGKANGSTVDAKIFKKGDTLLNGKFDRQVASIEGLNPVTLIKYIYEINKKNYYQFISHPKLLTKLELVLLNILLFYLNNFTTFHSDFRISENI